MEPEITPLAPGEPFCFSCSPDRPCFNECCRDLNQFLTPYDILRLKRHLGMRSNAFLAVYTTESVGPETGLPIISLKADPAHGMRCPFVTPAGCRVYPARPSSCRTYPLIRGAGRHPITGAIQEQYLLLKEQHCRGFRERRKINVEQWTADQEIATYNEMNDRMLEIIRLKKRHTPGTLDITTKRIFHMALYDLDGFRDYLTTHGEAPASMERKKENQEITLEEETGLLKYAIQWVQKEIFGSQGTPGNH